MRVFVLFVPDHLIIIKYERKRKMLEILEKAIIFKEGWEILDKPVKPLLAFDLHALKVQCEKNFLEVLTEKLIKYSC